MKTARWIVLGITVLSGVMCFAIYCAPRIINRLLSEPEAIGIIGSADGPTSIFVSNNPAQSLVLPVIFVISLFAMLFFRLKSKQL